MSASGVTTCPACHGLMGAGAWLCGPCWEALPAWRRAEITREGRGRRDALARAASALRHDHTRKGHG